MDPVNFPRILPQAIRDGFQGTFSRQPKRFQMEDSQYRVKRESVAQLFVYSLSWKMTWLETQIFEAWIEYSLAQGAGYFTIKIGGVPTLVRPLTAAPVYTPMGIKWGVKMDVEELRAKPVVSSRTGVLPVWPTSLPVYEQDSYSIGKVLPMTRTDIESGYPDERVRFKQRLTQFTGKILCTPEQRELFWDYHRDTLINGSAWFMGPFASARSTDFQRVRFVESPVETPTGAWYSITMKLETVNAPIMSREEFLQYSDFINDYVEADYIEDDYVGRYTD